jgi:Cellulase (glycosyl hydrolase family 5)
VTERLGHRRQPTCAAARIRALRIALPVICLLALALPGHAGAARGLEISIMDDELLLGHSRAHVDRQMEVFQSLGVDRVRVSAFWEGNAPDPESAQRPAGFDPANPDDPRYRWGALDRVVDSAAAHGLRVMLTISTPAPLWAAGRNDVWEPSAAEFGLFAGAVATRYADRVDLYGIANEPNQGGWLQPQSDSRGLAAPHHYRGMVLAAYPRIKAADPDSVALIGNLASSGSQGRGRRFPIRPLQFLRAMACVDGRLRVVRRGRCRRFRPVPADGIGHHPYQFFRPPSRGAPHPDDAGIADARRLLRLADALVRRGRVRASRRLDLHYAEFGYQTDPPDPFAGIALSRHARWLQEAAYLAWRTPRVRSLNQFRLTDGAVSGSGFSAFREFQTGLLFRDGRAKPAFGSFPDPVVLAGGRLWGQVRPGAEHSVVVEHRAPGSRRFRAMRGVATDAGGYFTTRVRGRGEWRFRWQDGVSDSVGRG